MKIDAHQHFWKYNTSDYSWINDQMGILKGDFLPEDLFPVIKTMGIDGTIAVQARQSLEETRWLLNLAHENDFIRGVVGWLDLCSPKIESQLDEFSKNSKLVGIRHVVHDEADDHFMDRSDFQNGISLLSKYNLGYDLLIFPKHLPLATKLVRKFPRQKFILDHIAKPNIKAHILYPWKTEISLLAELPNVFCKLSGMVTEADWEHWKPEDFTSYLDTVFNSFGEDRLMIGSDWPVCLVAGRYKEVMSIVIEYCKVSGPNSLEKIMGGNCRKFYLDNRS
jgi:L-fuconolactonase